MTNKNDMSELYDLYPSGRNPKVLKSPKGYDRFRDRKSQKLYDYEDEEALDETYKDSEDVF